MSFFSGIVDENEHIRLGGYPAPFCDMLGLMVEKYALYPESLTNAFRATDGKSFNGTLWSDVIHLKSAKAIATYVQDYYAGSPAITQNRFGRGNAFYVGTAPDNKGLDWLIEVVCKMADVQPVSAKSPAGVAIIQLDETEKIHA